MTSYFDRALDPDFVALLAAEAKKPGWWADVLADPKLFVALRGKSLNVYWRGQSLFYVEATSSGLKVTTHEKYLVDPALASQVPLVGGSFDVAGILKKGGFIGRYVDATTLAKMKSAAGLFSGLEKTGCHEIAVRNPTVIDCEIAFPGVVSPSEDTVKKSAPRVDLASLEPDGKDARLVFWEAKHYSNPGLRADDGLPPVCRQVATYHDYLSANRETIVESYANVAANLVSISAMRPVRTGRPLSPLVSEVATRERRLTLGAEPKVGLIIFGFDAGQRDHPGWKKHREKLNAIPHVLAVGDATGVRI
jgi:hypothetical protein